MVAYNHPMYQVYLLGLGCLYLPVYDPSPSKLFSLNHKVIMVMTFLRTKSSPPNLPPRCEAHQHGTKTSVDTRLLLLRNVTFFGDGENVKRDPNSLQRLERWPTPMVRGFFFQVTAASIRLDNFCVHQLKIYERLVFETTKQKKLSYLRKRAKFHLHSTLEGF